jgi:hypothetical protein
LGRADWLRGNLVTNAVVTWNTVYMAAVIERLRAEGKTVNEEDIARLSPARYEHINPYGKYRFEAEEGLSRTRLRPLRPLLNTRQREDRCFETSRSTPPGSAPGISPFALES